MRPALSLLAPLIVLLSLAGGSGAVQAGSSEASVEQAPTGADGAPPREETARRLLLGRSHQGRPIRVIHLPGDGPRVLVVGCIHGTECAGIAVVRQLVRTGAQPDIDLWLVSNLNPDGLAGGHRQNGRGVDLNRNFPSQWRPLGVRWDPQYSGPAPASERETRIAMNLVERIRPAATVWYHQHLGAEEFVRAWGPSIPAGRRYARDARILFRRLPWPHGTAPNWQNHLPFVSRSFVVEFPPGVLDVDALRRHARAALHLAGGS